MIRLYRNTDRVHSATTLKNDWPRNSIPFLQSGLDLARYRSDQLLKETVVQQLARAAPIAACLNRLYSLHTFGSYVDGLLSIACRSWTELLFVS
mmetsp:Transcript_35429/g.79503  ORF Transcript_35429/g.79503 Transcript_35429/m.79503 type:complete len:94 (+) Transcript_35429:364-645(+)